MGESIKTPPPTLDLDSFRGYITKGFAKYSFDFVVNSPKTLKLLESFFISSVSNWKLFSSW